MKVVLILLLAATSAVAAPAGPVTPEPIDALEALEPSFEWPEQAVEWALADLAIEEARTALAAIHPDWQAIVYSDGFQQWVAADARRRAVYRNASRKNDVRAADRLLREWKGRL